MSNMSYCRFQNTAGDLHECVEALEDGELNEEEDKDEFRAAKQMRKLCERFIQQWDDYYCD